MDFKNKFQSKGDVATYYIEIDKDDKKIIKVDKYDADCIKKKLAITDKICDSIFHIRRGGKSQLKERWIFVETKGDDFSEAVEQLEKTLDRYSHENKKFTGRIVATRVPLALPTKFITEFDRVSKKFIQMDGDLQIRNNPMKEVFRKNGNDFISEIK